MIFGFNTDIKYGETVYHVQSEAREHDSLLQTQVFVKGRCLGKYETSFAERIGKPDFNEDALHDLLKTQHKHFVDCARSGTIELEIEKDDAALVAKAAAAQPTEPPPSSAPQPPPLTAPSSDSQDTDRISISIDDPDLAAIAEASAAVGEKEVASTPPQAPPKLEQVEEDVAPPVAAADPMLDSFMAELAAAEKEPPPPPLPIYRVEPAGSVIGKGVGIECLEPIVAPDGTSVLLNVQVEVDAAPAIGAQITARISVPNSPAAYVYAQTNHDGTADVRVGTAGLNSATGILIQAALHDKSASRKFTLKRQ